MAKLIFMIIIMWWVFSLFSMFSLDFSNIQERTHSINTVAEYTDLIKRRTPEEVARYHENCDTFKGIASKACNNF